MVTSILCAWTQRCQGSLPGHTWHLAPWPAEEQKHGFAIAQEAWFESLLGNLGQVPQHPWVSASSSANGADGNGAFLQVAVDGIMHEGPPHLVVVSFLLGHCLHGQGSQAEVVLQKQGVDVLQWHVALRVGRGRLVLENAKDLGVSGWDSGGIGLWGGGVCSWLPAGGWTPFQPQQSS